MTAAELEASRANLLIVLRFYRDRDPKRVRTYRDALAAHAAFFRAVWEKAFPAVPMEGRFAHALSPEALVWRAEQVYGLPLDRPMPGGKPGAPHREPT